MATYDTIPMVVGATLPQLTFRYADPAGVPIDLTGYAIKMEVQREDRTTFQRAATLIDAPNGLAAFVWQLADFSVPGRYFANLVVTDAGLRTLKVSGLSFLVAPAYPAA